MEFETSDIFPYRTLRNATIISNTMVIRTFLSRLRPVAANAVAIALILGFYQLQLVPHISVDTVAFLWQLAIWYLLIFAAFACVAPVGTSKGEHLLRASVKVAMGKYRSVTDEERLVALVVLVKAYFIPIMVQFMIQNFAETVRLLSVLLSDSGITLMSMQGFNILIYPILFATMLVIDVSYFVYGYIVDHPRFGSPIRSVEPLSLIHI